MEHTLAKFLFLAFGVTAGDAEARRDLCVKMVAEIVLWALKFAEAIQQAALRSRRNRRLLL